MEGGLSVEDVSLWTRVEAAFSLYFSIQMSALKRASWLQVIQQSSLGCMDEKRLTSAITP